MNFFFKFRLTQKTKYFLCVERKSRIDQRMHMRFDENLTKRRFVHHRERTCRRFHASLLVNPILRTCVPGIARVTERFRITATDVGKERGIFQPQYWEYLSRFLPPAVCRVPRNRVSWKRCTSRRAICTFRHVLFEDKYRISLSPYHLFTHNKCFFFLFFKKSISAKFINFEYFKRILWY